MVEGHVDLCHTSRHRGEWVQRGSSAVPHHTSAVSGATHGHVQIISKDSQCDCKKELQESEGLRTTHHENK